MQKCTLYFLSVVLLTSCSVSWRIEKRHYRDGFYFGRITAHQQPDQRQSGRTLLMDTTQVMDDVQTVAESEPQLIEAQSVSDTSALEHKTERSAVREKSAVENGSKTGEVKKETAKIPHVEVPQEARRLNVMLLVAIGFLTLGIIAAIVTFLPVVGPVFGVLIAAAPFLILGALGFSIAVMVSARRRQLAATDNEVRAGYAQLHKRARIVFWITVAVITVFLLFLALVIAALSKLQ